MIILIVVIFIGLLTIIRHLIELRKQNNIIIDILKTMSGDTYDEDEEKHW